MAAEPAAIFLTAQIEWGVAEARRDFQWAFFADLMALKLPCLERQAATLWEGGAEERERWEAEGNSRRKTERMGDHQGLDL